MSGILSRFGVGAAEVDTVLPTDSVIAGETVEATVELRGGETAQDVEAVYFALLTRYATDDGRSTGVVDRHRLADSFTIEAGEERSFEVDLGIPRDAPATLDRTDVWIETGLDVEWAVDPDDSDPIEIRPDAHLRALLDALDALGFALRRADCEATSAGVAGRQFVQTFEFRPRDGPFDGRVDELELVYEPADGGATARLEVDRRGGLLSEMADVDERWTGLSFAEADADALEPRLRSTVDELA